MRTSYAMTLPFLRECIAARGIDVAIPDEAARVHAAAAVDYATNDV